MPDGMLMLDKDLNILLVNNPYIEMFEYPEGLVATGKFVGDMFHYQAERGDLGDISVDEMFETAQTVFRKRESLRYEAHLPSGKIIEDHVAPTPHRNLSTTLRHRRFLFTDSFLLLWKWRVG